MARKILIVLFVVALAGILLFGLVHGYESWRGAIAADNFKAGDKAGAARVQGQWDSDRSQAQAATIAKQQADAQETLRRLEIQKGNQDAKDQRDARVARDAAAARTAADGLRVAAAAYLHAAGCDGRAGDSAVECIRAAAAKVGDVLGQCAARYSEVAAAADDSRSRGLKCEADYDAVTIESRAIRPVQTSAPGAQRAP